MGDNNQLSEGFKNYTLKINAKLNFKLFLDDINSNDGKYEMINKTFEIIDEVIETHNDQFIKEVQCGQEFYRARIISKLYDDNKEKGIRIDNTGKFFGYDEKNSREPMLGISGNGRNNIKGASYLYVASDQETSCLEVKPQLGDLISLAIFKVNQPLHIMDFSSDKQFKNDFLEKYNMSLGDFFASLMNSFTQPVKSDDDYKITQIVSDYIRKTGIDGIKYQSFYTKNGCNYTIFNCHPLKIQFCESKIVLYEQAKHLFWDFNNKEALVSYTNNEELKHDKSVENECINYLKQILK